MVDVGGVALTALLLAAGCKPVHLEEVARLLGHEPIADTHIGRYEQVAKAIKRVEEKHA